MNGEPQIRDTVVQGKLVTVSKVINSHALINLVDTDLENYKQSIRQEIVKDLVEYMIQSKLVEITQVQDYARDSIIIRAHAHLTPDEQVRLIRTMK